jgi:signal peptidase I
MKAFLREILVTALLALALFLGIQATVQSFVVVGISMEPSFYEGQRLLVSKVAYYLSEPKRGDVIVFQPFDNQHEDYIKRIIALPGDEVEVRKNTVYVNGSPLYETYINDLPEYTMKRTTVPANSYFVLGDNRNHSNDSHSGWFVPRQNIVGKVWLSIWPPQKWGLAPHYNLSSQITASFNPVILVGG